MKKYAIFGNPVIHSKSPLIFNSLFEEFGQTNIYKSIMVDSASEIIEIFDQFNLSGANITSPFKETILPFLDKIDNVASEINAVNTVLKKGEHLYGFNTDVYGVENAIVNNGLNVKGEKCIVIGAGGAAKAAIYALRSLGAIIYSTNRTDSKSQSISETFNCEHIAFKELRNSLKDTYLVVIAVKKLDIDITENLKNTIILDANYHSKQLPGKYLRYIDGHDWLINQASRSFEIFFDKIPNHLMMKNMLNKKNFKSSNIALIGMPGVGKSFYGKIISEKLNKDFYDTDALVEERSNSSISDIFSKYDENKFRELEEEVIRYICEKKNILVAFGGGSILSSKVREILSREFFVINLHSDLEKLEEFLRTTENDNLNRPLLDKLNLKMDIERIFNDRKEYYFSLSDLIITLPSNAYDENINAIEKELSCFND